MPRRAPLWLIVIPASLLVFTICAPPPEGTPAPVVGCQMRGALPDPSCTPGVANPDVVQGNIAVTICRVGWTATIRPPVDYTDPLKLRQMQAYGETGSPADYEEDHLIPLELGGDPRAEGNLWPEPRRSIAHP